MRNVWEERPSIKELPTSGLPTRMSVGTFSLKMDVGGSSPPWAVLPWTARKKKAKYIVESKSASRSLCGLCFGFHLELLDSADDGPGSVS